MAVLKSKGTTFSLGIGNAAAAVAQIISMDLPEVQAETFEADTLANNTAGIPYKPTGRTEGGSFSAELFLDINTHSAITALLTTPAVSAGLVTFVSNSTMSFGIGGLGLGGSVQLKDGLKGKLTAKLDGMPTYTP